MRYRAFVLSVALALGAGCGSSNNGGDGGAGDAASGPTQLFMGSYTATTNVSAELGVVRDVATLTGYAEAYRFDMAQGMLSTGSAVSTLLTRVDQEFQGGAASGDYSVAATVRRGVTLGLAASTDDQRDVAHETVAKPLAVALELGAQSELRAAIADMQAGNADSARAHWDRAAAYFSGLADSIGEYQAQTVPGVWGTRDALASGEIAGLVVDQLRRGRAAIDAGAGRTVLEIGTQAQVALTRLFFLAGVKYSRVIQNAVTAMAAVDAAAQAEGTYSFEGVVLAIAGAQPTAAAVAAARAHWRGDTATITEAQLLRDAAALYVQLNADALTGYVAGTDDARWATIARLSGALDVLAEALAYAGQDVTALSNQLVAARGLSEGGDHAGALEQLTAVQAAIGRVGTTP
jgi:hypothetical protein